jgi:hypothetical protein
MIGALYISWHCSKAAWMELSFLNILYVAVGIHTDTGCLHGQAWSGWDMDSDRATVPDQGGPQERENSGWIATVPRSAATMLKSVVCLNLGVGCGPPSPPLSSAPGHGQRYPCK